jgi:RNA polymerase sigma-70 factor (ECF subfamily)
MGTDEALAARSARGDEQAFRHLVERYRGPLYAVARGILHDGDHAADAVQEAFLKAYASLGEYRGRGAFAGWLRRILVNQCLSQLRSRQSWLSLDELAGDFACRERGPEEQALAGSETERIRAAMGRLPAHYRAALVLRAVEGLSYREIGGLLGVPDSTVETWIHRGRLRMRALLGDLAGVPKGSRLAALWDAETPVAPAFVYC